MNAGPNYASVAVSGDEGVSPVLVTRLAIGASAEIMGISLGLLYNHGLLNTNDSGDVTIRNRVVTMQAGIVFSIG